MILFPPVAPLTEAQCVARFDRALLVSDGAALRALMHPKIVKNSPASGAHLTTFLKTIFWPALARPMALSRGGKPIPLHSPGNVLHFVFKDAAGWSTEVRNAGDTAPVFRPVTIRTANGFRSGTDYAGLVFFAAYAQSNSPKRNGYEEMLDAQALIERWAPRLDRLGIRGGSDGWAAPFEPWRILLPKARRELDRMKPPR